MNRLRLVALAIVLFITAGTAFSVRLHLGHRAQGRLTVKVQGIKPASGQLLAAIYNSSQGFPSNSASAVKRTVVRVTGAETDITFAELMPGTYAVSIVHDANSNNRMDTNKMGIPKEGYGVSNNAKGFLGPPKWEDAHFQVKDGDQHIAINLNY